MAFGEIVHFHRDELFMARGIRDIYYFSGMAIVWKLMDPLSTRNNILYWKARISSRVARRLRPPLNSGIDNYHPLRRCSSILYPR